MKEVPANKKKSLGKLPTPVRNKMGYMEKGGSVPKAKKPKIDISREEYENQTREERAAYNRLVKEMDRKIKEAGEKARKRNFKEGGMLKKPRPEKVKKRTPGGGRTLTEQEKFNIKMQRAKRMRDAYRPSGPKKYKKGGSVKGKCKIDGIAIRGKTRAKRK